MPTTRYVDKTNGHLKELSINLFQYLHHVNTPIRTRTIDDVAIEAERRAHQTFAHWSLLHAILLEHENTLRTRWIKKSLEQRKKLLLTAWPNMPASHRADFQAIARETVEQRRAGTKFRKDFLFPYINLEDLLKAKNLLLFFQSRGHNLPDVFAHHDLMATLPGRRSTAIQPPYVDGYTMFFGARVPEAYGMVTSWDEVPFGFTDDDAFDLMWAGIGWHPGDGLLILEIQETILEFLVKCAELILHDLLPLKDPPGPISLYSPKPVMLESALSPITPIPSEASWFSVAAAAAEAPYRVPVQFDFSRLRRLVNAMLAEAEDILWTLREDPGVFQDTVNNFAQHRQEVLRNKHGRPHPNYNTPGYWNAMFRYVVQDAYWKVTIWDAIKRALDNLETLREELYPFRGIRITPLPWEYEQQLCHFSYLIKRVLPIFVSSFHGIVGSPALRDYYIREDIDIPNAIMMKQKHDPPAGSFLWYFLYLVSLFPQRDQLELVGIYNVLDEFERVSRNAKSLGAPQDDMISPFIASAISELAVVSEIQRQLDWHQPRILPTRLSEEDKENEYAKRAKFISIFMRIEGNFYDFGMPLMRMKYPDDKRMTAATVQKMREAEAALDSFWESVDEYYNEKFGKKVNDLLAEILSPRQLQRTPKWVAPAPASPSPSPPEISDNLESQSEQVSTVQIEEHFQRVTLQPAKTKVKTRGHRIEDGSVDDVQETTQDLEPLPSTIMVSKRAYNMFSMIFKTDNQELPGEIPWTEFLHGMSSTGFAVEKQHGSAWLFTPPNESQRSIIFHAPHPTNKIPIHIARRHGRRLTRAYGWTGATFVSSR